jgi:hypothetical protein
MNKRRRISEDGKSSSPIKDPITPNQKPLPNFMTPTKSSLAKSYPHLALQQHQQRVPSPTRQLPRRSIPPESLTKVLGGNGRRHEGRSFLDIANEAEEMGIREANLHVNKEPTGLVMSNTKETGLIETHLAGEEEIERRKGIFMRRLRLLRVECENLEQQLDQATSSQQNTFEAQKKAQSNANATMYFLLFCSSDNSELLLRSNDASLSHQPITESAKPSIPSAAPKKLKNPLPLLRFIHPLTFYSTNSRVLVVNDELVRHFELKGYTMEKELYFEVLMSVNEKKEQITDLKIKTSPWAQPELSTFLKT